MVAQNKYTTSLVQQMMQGTYNPQVRVTLGAGKNSVKAFCQGAGTPAKMQQMFRRCKKNPEGLSKDQARIGFPPGPSGDTARKIAWANRAGTREKRGTLSCP